MNIKTISGILVLLGIGGGIGFLAGSRYGKNKIQTDFIKDAYPSKEARENRDQMLKELYNGTYYNEEAMHKRDVRIKADELNARKEQYFKDEVEQIQEENGYSVPDEPVEENEVTTDEYLASHESPSEGDTDGDDIPIPKTIDSERYIRYIDVDDFESETEYDHEDITYYEEDEVFCDENDKRIEEPDQLFGINAINQFGKNPINPDDVIFVRNNWFEKVYQITRIHNSYGRLVLGIDEEYPIN